MSKVTNMVNIMKKFYLLLLCVFMLLPMVSEASRGITVKLKAGEQVGAADAGNVKLYSESHALVIGIDEYHNGWPRLSGAVKDAKLVAVALRRQGFDVTLKYNLGSLALQQELKKFFAIKGANPESRLLLWYAGHGHTVDGEGYLVSADTPPDVNPEFLISALPMRDFGGLMRLAKSKHVLSVFDSCFSGTIFQARSGASPKAITRKTTQPVRQFITSGDAGQQVRDDGSFRTYFIRALRSEENADFNGDGYMTGEELGLYMNQQMSALTNAAQTPKSGKLQDVKFNQGDFVFKLSSPTKIESPRSRVVASNNQGSFEISYWESVKDSHDADMYQSYIDQYPKGKFASLAKLKIKKIGSVSRAIVAKSKPVDAPKYALTIDVIPSNAKVKVLNIGPKYQRGMLLKAGRYHVEVSKNGYESQRQWVVLKNHNVETVMKLKNNQLNNILGIEMIHIPSGSFLMGSDKGEYSGKPAHRVEISGFNMGKYEITQAQWLSVMDSNPSEYKGDNNPVEMVSWDDVQLFIRKLNTQTGKVFRLPSEAEWEYAAKAGGQGKWGWGDDVKLTSSHAWYGGNSKRRAHPVGEKKPNAYGLYDMHGNVWEWVQDCWNGNYRGAPTHGGAWVSETCEKRVLRGGSWINLPLFMHSTVRSRHHANKNYSDNGFRLVLD
ncbi:MAG: SUMF1/EgtB/PvdO family nonheme iron enzyme [Mariprofundaceae bacterium]